VAYPRRRDAIRVIPRTIIARPEGSDYPSMQKAAAAQTRAPDQALPRPLSAIALMSLACVTFACLDTTAKYLVVVVKLPTGEVVWVRYFGQLITRPWS
jgi:hypothetical protein